MFLFGNKIEKLTKFIEKALTKAIEAGNKIIALYENAEDEIDSLKGVIEKLQEILNKINAEKEDNDKEVEKITEEL